jgi:multicomponent Na+:H+ antiporter subunit G
MHASSVTETLGVALILLGLMLQSGLNLVSAKLLILGILIFITGPTATHAIAHAAMLRGLKPILKSDRSEKEIS